MPQVSYRLNEQSLGIIFSQNAIDSVSESISYLPSSHMQFVGFRNDKKEQNNADLMAYFP